MSDSRSWGERVAPTAEAIVANPLFAYAAVLALQLRFIWGIWTHKDTTAGDTSYYYLLALDWAHHLHDDIVLSPLYTDYFGTVRWFVHDAASAVTVHRVLIVLVAALLVLAVGRALLGPVWGLFLAVWWCVVPANFNVDYEMHLMGFFPILVALLLVGRSSGRAARGVAFAVLVAGGFLLRQELFILAAIFAVGVLAAEWRDRPTARTALRVYGVPLLVVTVIVAAATLQSPDHGTTALTRLHQKHDLNMCQIYAFNYQQRHPKRFTGNPFIDCAPLMQRVFGKPMPSFAEEIRANPHAVAEFVAWNGKLTPIGLQVSLFGATSRGTNPGYYPVKTYRRYAAVLTLLAVVIVVLGALAMLGDREHWIAQARRRFWPLLILAGASVTGLFVALTQRPRAEYIYGLTLTLMVLAVVSAAAIARRIQVAGVAPLAAAVLPLALIVTLPSYYRADTPTPLHDALDRLDGLKGTMRTSETVLVTSGYNWEICAYFARDLDDHCSSPAWAGLQRRARAGQSVASILDAEHADVIYADPVFRLDPKFAAFVASKPKGWRTVSAGTGSDGEWSVLVRRGG